MIDPAHHLSITNKPSSDISRGSIYYLPRPAPEPISRQRHLDRLHLEFPSPLADVAACWSPRAQDRPPSREDVDAADGIEALYRRPRTTSPNPVTNLPISAARLSITQPNQVWRWTLPTSRWRAASSICVVLDSLAVACCRSLIYLIAHSASNP